MAGNHTLGTIRGSIEIDYNGAGIIRAQRDVDETAKRSEKLEKAVDRVGKVFLGFAKRAAIMGASSLALNGAIQAVAATIAVLAPLAAATFAALPGLILAAGAAMAVYKASVLGVGEALKLASGDSAKFEEALKKLSPEAQKFARAWKSAGEALKPMQQAMQNAFFGGLAGQVTKVSAGILKLRNDATWTAASFNMIAKEVLRFAASSVFIENVRKALSGVRQFLSQIRPAIVPLMAAFAGLAGQAGQFGDSLGYKVGQALIKLANFIKRVDLAGLFEKAGPIIEQVGAFLSDVGSILGDVMSIFNVDGQGALGVLGTLVSQLAAFLKTAEGQAALKAIGEAMAAISGAAGQVFLELLKQLAPILIQLAPGVGQLATQLSAVLVPALQIVGPLLLAIAGFLSANMDWIGPLALAIGVAAAAYKGYVGVMKAWEAAEKIAQALRLRNAASWVASKAAVVGHTIALGANKVALAASTAAGWVRNTAAIVANKVAMIASRVAMVAWQGIMMAVRAATLVWAAAQWVLNAALMGNPIVLIVLAVIALIVIIVLIATKTTWFQTIWKVVWTAVKAAFKWVVDFIVAYVKWWLSVVTAVFNAVWAAIKWVIDKIVAIFNFWMSVAKAVWNAVVEAIKWAIQKIKDAIEGIKIIIGRVTEFFGKVKDAIAEKFNAAVAFVKGIPGRIIDAIGDLGGKLYAKGRTMIQGFIDGIKDMIGRAKQVAGDVVRAVTDFFPGSPAKTGPLSGKGYVLLRARRMMEDMAHGIELGSQMPVQATASVAGGVAGALPDSVSVARSGASVAGSGGVAPVATPNHAERSMKIENINVNGTWDLARPEVPRQFVAKLHEELDKYEKEHR